MGFDPITAANLQVRLAEDEAEITASQKLRYHIFCEEMGAKANAEVIAQKRDFDKYDDVCDHLLVIDNDRSGEEAVVGTYRLLRRSVMPKIGQFYTEDEFDISPLVALEGEILELGRSCVEENYRNRSVMQLLWRGIGAYVNAYDVKLMFGCASFNGVDPDAHALALSYLHYNHLAPEDLRPKALPDRYTPMNRLPKEKVDAKLALRELPALVKGYLRLNGYIGDGAVLDHDYNTTDVSIVVKTDIISDKYAQRYKSEG